MANPAKDGPRQPDQASGLDSAAAQRPSERTTAETPAPSLRTADASARPRIAARHEPPAPTRASDAIQEAVPLPSAESDALSEAVRHYRAAMASALVKPASPAAIPSDVAATTAGAFVPLLPASPERPRSRTADEMLAAAVEAAPRLKLWLPPEGEASASPSPRQSAVTEPEPAPVTKLPSEPPTPEDIFVTDELTPELASEQGAEKRGDGRPVLPVEVFAADDMAPTGNGWAEETAVAVEQTVAERGPDDRTLRAQELAAEAPLLLPADAADAALAEESSAPLLAPSHHAAMARDDAEARAFPMMPVAQGKEDRPVPPRHNLRKSAGPIAFALVFGLALAWVLLWRGGYFRSVPQEASIEISPEVAVVPAAGGAQPADLAGGGATPQTVRDTELLLRELDFEPGPVDGVLDDATRDAIRRYQQAAGLPETGEPSPELLEEMIAVTAAMQGDAN